MTVILSALCIVDDILTIEVTERKHSNQYLVVA